MTTKSTTQKVDVDFVAELISDGASEEALSRLTKDEQALYFKLKRENDMAAKKKVSKKKAVSKKTPARQRSAKKVINPDKPETKMDIAIRIFAKEYPKMRRKDIISLFMSEAGLTKAGASTYHSLIKKKFEDEK